MIPFNPIPEPPKRRKPSLSEKVAACLVKMTGPDGLPLIDEPEKKTVKEILAEVQWDHTLARELLGSNHPMNIMPLRVKQHVEVKTLADAKKIAKTRRNRTREEEFRHRLLHKAGLEDAPRDVKRHRIASRPFQQGHRPMRSGKQKIGGGIVRREERT